MVRKGLSRPQLNTYILDILLQTMPQKVDLLFYMGKKDRYEKAIPKLRKMIKELENVGNNNVLTPYGQRKKTALIHELGRIQGVLQVINSLQNVVESEIKTTYADILIDMIRRPDPDNFVSRWYQVNALDIVMKKKGLRTLIWVGSENIEK